MAVYYCIMFVEMWTFILGAVIYIYTDYLYLVLLFFSVLLLLFYHLSPIMYTIPEDLILPAATVAWKTMFGNDEYAKKLVTIPFSDTTIARRVCEMAPDMREQLIEKLKSAEAFSLQVDVSLDVSKDAQLLGFVRFVDQNKMYEEFLFFYKKLPERNKIWNFQSDWWLFQSKWDKLGKVCCGVYWRCARYDWSEKWKK